MDLHVSPRGDDRWSGRRAIPNADRTDGPLATLAGARDRIRSLREPGRKELDVARQVAMLDGPVTVWVHDGVYRITEPLRFGPEDAVPVTYRAAKGAKPVIDGGRRLTGWEETTVNDVKVWTLDLERDGAWPLPDRRQLFVNGRRATRARLPKVGFHQIGDALLGPEGAGWGKPGNPTFTARVGDVEEWSNLADVDAVAFHYWVDERLPVVGYDPATRKVSCAAVPRAPLTLAWNRGDCPYFVENVLEGLNAPGEWAFDSKAKRLWYVPRRGERPATSEVVMPQAVQLLQVVGDADKGAPVAWLRLVGLTFRHAASVIPGEPGERPGVLGMQRDARTGKDGAWLASGPQGAIDQAGALYFRGAAGCAVEDCTVEHVGGYAIQLDDGCREIRLCGNTLRDLGAGGIVVSGSDATGPRANRTRLLRIADNHIHHGGEITHSGIGILVRHASECVVVHNHVHDFYYTAISVGWVWGYSESVARNNVIAFNHLHDLGKGWLSDMGGIYTLGPQPGTVIRNNLVHDVSSAAYGGWAIYPDEGTSHVVIEDNVAYRTDCSVFHQHYGRENTVRNNIFAFGGEGLVAISKHEAHRSATFTGNIFLSDRGYVYCGGYGYKPGDRDVLASDLNTVWDTQIGKPLAGGSRKSTETAVDTKKGGLAWKDWVALGNDRHSVVADPLFVDAVRGDFSLRPESPALKLGFRPIDTSRVGPRPRAQRDW
jgi:hypothetical protein